MTASYHDPLRVIHTGPRISKPPHPRRQNSGHQPQHQSATSNHRNEDRQHYFHHKSHDPFMHNDRSLSSEEQTTPYEQQQHLNEQYDQQEHCVPSPTRLRSLSPRIQSSPRSSTRPPTIFAQLKAKLEAPKRPTITTTPLPQPAHSGKSLNRAPVSPDIIETDLTSPSSPAHDTRRYYSSGNCGHDNAWTTSPSTLFGIPCSPASQRAYSNHNLDIEESFLRLQLEDSGKIEHRTIAFATHLTISRWEPTDASASAAADQNSPESKTASPPSSSGESIEKSRSDRLSSRNPRDSESHPSSPKQQPQPQPQPQQQQQQQRNDPVYAARLVSLANYIRHILSLCSGNSTTNSQIALVQQQQQQQQQQLLRQQKLQACRPTSFSCTQQARNNSGTRIQDAASLSLPSPLSAGPGPIKPSAAMSMRKHRYSSEYYDYHARRQVHQQSRQTLERQDSLGEPMHRLPSPISPTFLAGRRLSQQQAESIATSISPLLRVPFPNLTLTLALIFVDRLKAKFPDAKGEPGCSLRLFLVAYIIAAKYRCSVELAALMRRYNTCVAMCEAEDLDESYDSNNSASIMERLARANSTAPITPVTPNNIPNRSAQTMREHYRDEAARLEQILWDMRSYAELIFSNQEWVRLLCLGSFFRPPPTTQSASSATTAAAASARTSPTQPMDRSIHSATSPEKLEPKPLPIQSIPSTRLAGVESANTLSCDTKIKSMTNLNSAQITATTNVTATATTTTTTTKTSTATPTSILQVEDLNRMETEFLTFLGFDLTAKSQDLDTCWNLLIGNKEI
ncbi:hypothetical protein BGZ80_004163 [Entomortierella chlamydospora]|uniref:Cyclin N-terminal domain-containing protein n=1 Tax=Entomortierella chlamydospora TaxID=101097 RepID=A0A9P6N1A8_9FUNG|nr:hypothetical protein BGZ80_004163 [Entomortierella chlamydospora]